LDELEAANGPSELHAALRVVGGEVMHSFGRAERVGGEGDDAPLDNAVECMARTVSFSDNRVGRHDETLEIDPRLVISRHGGQPRHPYARCGRIDEEERESVTRPGASCRTRENEQLVGRRGELDEHLRAGDVIRAVTALRAGGRR
jgi:hypothetical protein